MGCVKIDITLPGFRLAMRESGSNGLTVFRINGITKSPSTSFVFFIFGRKPSLHG